MRLAVGKLPTDSNQCYWSPKDQSDVTRPSPCWWDLGTRLGIRYYRLLVLNHFMTEITFIFLEHLASGRNKTDGMGHNCWELKLNPGWLELPVVWQSRYDNQATTRKPLHQTTTNHHNRLQCVQLYTLYSFVVGLNALSTNSSSQGGWDLGCDSWQQPTFLFPSIFVSYYQTCIYCLQEKFSVCYILEVMHVLDERSENKTGCKITVPSLLPQQWSCVWCLDGLQVGLSSTSPGPPRVSLPRVAGHPGRGISENNWTGLS